MKLYSGRLSMFGAKVEIALREKCLAFELQMVPFDLQAGYWPKHPDVMRINPKRQVPVLIDGALEIYDSTEIFEYLEDRYPEHALWPAGSGNAVGRARARQLEHAADEVFFPSVVRLMGLRADPDPVASPEWQAAVASLTAYYDRMETTLAERPYLAGEYGYADVAFFMAQFFAARHTVPMSAAHPRLLAWRRRVASRNAVAPVIGAMVDYLRGLGRTIAEFE